METLYVALCNFTYVTRVCARWAIIRYLILHIMISFKPDSLKIVASKIVTIRWRLISIIEVPLVLAAPSEEYDFNLNIAVAHQAQQLE